MKKVLALIIMASLAQGYEHLSQLPVTSRIRKMCYPVVESGWFWTRKNECDALEKAFRGETKVDTNALFREFSNEELQKMITAKSWQNTKAKTIHYAKERMGDECFRILFGMSDMNEDSCNECEEMEILAGKLCKESFEQFEQAVRDNLTR